MVAVGDPIFASDLNDLQTNEITAWRPVTAVKSALTGRNTTTTITADPDLSITLVTSSTYFVQADLFLSSVANAAGDWRGAFSWTGTATVSYGGQALVTGLASGTSGDIIVGPTARADTTTPGTEFLAGCSTSGMYTTLTGFVVCSTAVTLTLSWAQRVSNANDTRVLEGSRLTAFRVS